MSESKGLDWHSARERMERARLAIESGGQAGEHLETLRRERAELLAHPVAAQTTDEGEVILVFRLGSELYGAAVSRLVEVVSRPAIAAVPGATAAIAGLIQVRGEIRVVWDLRKLLGTSLGEAGEMKSVLLIRNATGADSGLLVDEVMDIRRIPEGERRSAPESVKHAVWATADMVTVLNTESLLAGVTGENTAT